jgi:phosphoesterase RecJ-like protein
VSAELIESGAEPNLIADHLYETWDQKKFNLLVRTLNTLEIKHRVAVTHVTRDMLRKTGTRAEDTENFSNYPRMIDSVGISAFFRELGTSAWKVSLRSKGEVNVAKIAEQFGGGGHKNAAGYKAEGDLNSVKEALLKAGRKLY